MTTTPPRGAITCAGIAALIVYIATIFGANWSIERFGIVSVGFGYMAPAGVYFAGVAFTMRDLVHEWLGRWWVIVAILAGAALSWFVSPTFAVASGAAFLVSELCDFAVYSPLRKRHWLLAVGLSNSVGLVVDSVLFLWLAFRSLEFLPGQLIGKATMTIAAVALLWLARRQVDLSFRGRPA